MPCFASRGFGMARSCIDDAELSLPCPKCRRRTKKTVAWVRAHTQLVCPGCSTKITLKTDELERGIRELERQFSDLKRSVRSITKRR
jgi:hypothetical protein